MKALLTLSLLVTVVTTGTISQAAIQCDYGGIQTALRGSADKLASGNPVRYIDFTNDAPFDFALERMKAVGIPPEHVQYVWAAAIRQICGARAQYITPASVGPRQTLSGLSHLLGIPL